MSTVNDQISDSVNQVNTLLTGSAPMQSMGMLNIAATETMGMSMYNAVTAQQNAQTSASAAAAASCAKMLQQSPPKSEKPKAPEEQLDLSRIEEVVQKLLHQYLDPDSKKST